MCSRVGLWALTALLFLTGCAGLNFKWEPLAFESPTQVLRIVESSPTPVEQEGIFLRLKVPESKIRKAEENLKLYTRLHDGKGMSLALRQSIAVSFQTIPGKDSFRQKMVTTFEGEGGQITEEIELSPRGEIVQFIEGHHTSRTGKFKVKQLSRTPLYPEEKIKVGSKWNYEEKAEVELESFWIKDLQPSPFLLKAESELTGFAEVDGIRCAVIRSTASQTKNQTLKVLFKTITAEIKAQIQDTVYFDYEKGRVFARVTEIRSHSVFPKLNLEDTGQSQSIYRIV